MVDRSVRLTVKLPQHLLDDVERRRRDSNETRSDVVREALERLFGRRAPDAAIERYVRGYREMPEDEAEVAENHRLACAALAAEPWE